MDPSRPEAMPAMLPATGPQAQGGRATYWGDARVTGQPGTVPIASPRPSSMRDDSWGPLRQGSGVSPDYIMPSIYYNTPTQAWMYTRVMSTNEMPVPAGSPQLLPGIAMSGPQIGGVFQVAQPQVAQVWPDVNGSVVQYSNVGFGQFNPGWGV